MKPEVSTCCGKPVLVAGDDREGTHYYVCTGCGKPCDAKQDNRSRYVIPCLCGATIESHAPETRCEDCGRVLVVEGRERSEAPGSRALPSAEKGAER